MKKKVLITGAEGQLAQTIQEIVSSENELDFIFVSKKELDITNFNNVSAFFSKNQFNYCINCAAFTNVEKAERQTDIAIMVNSEAVKNLALVCNETNTVLIQISTDYVFDGNQTKPYTVLDKTNPINEYGRSKLQGEQYLKQLMEKYFVIRTSWLYSKIYGNNFYKTILRKAKNKEQISVVNNQTSCPTNCEELSNYIIKLIKTSNTNFGIHHFSGSLQMTWYEFAKQILKENNLLESTHIVIDNNYVTFAKRPKYSVLQNTIANLCQ